MPWYVLNLIFHMPLVWPIDIWQIKSFNLDDRNFLQRSQSVQMVIRGKRKFEITLLTVNIYPPTLMDVGLKLNHINSILPLR